MFKNYKTPNLYIVTFVVLNVFFFSLQPAFSQGEKRYKLQPYLNPYVAKLNAVSSSDLLYSKDLVNIEYHTPFIFEYGINSIFSSNNWSLILGVSHINQQQYMELSFPEPYGNEYEFSDFSRVLLFTSNFLVFNAGLSRRLNDRFWLNIKVNYHISMTRKSRIKKYNLPYLVDDYGFHFVSTYDIETPDGIEEVQTKINSIRSEQKYKPFLMPELSLDYSVTPNFLLSLGFRTQFWSNPDNYRFELNMSGYVHAPVSESGEEPKSELLHSSRITPKGYYLWLGLKYDIPINTNKD